MADYFRSPSLFWWLLITSSLCINFLAYYSPRTLGFLPIIGPIAAYIGIHYHWITVITNLFALVAHVGEGLYALYLSTTLGHSLSCSMRWFLQTFILGFPSLSMLSKAAGRRKK
ncbi:unnamed protein product [Cylicocyclus nassatus]|uniref:Transmembrane protein 254 n=1 Tax=Cylicocyclus nassatus TaxID=53992 RepID=A0AA36M0U6_CYLNA|nr:unnamed protein product [Cylicocyclus nassatus]